MLFWILILLLINGVVSFATSVMNTGDTTTLWAVFSSTYLFYLGVTQTGILFAAIMRMSKSGWGRHFSRLGEILTLSFIPFAFIFFLIIYFGGVDHLFYWASPHVQEEGHHLSPFLGKGLFFWRNIISMALFYGMSWIYFRTCRSVENGTPVSDDQTRKMNVMAAVVMVFYVIANTNIAWDFGMTIIQHWESSIFTPYYWVGNILAGAAFLFLASLYFIPKKAGEAAKEWRLQSMGNVLFGCTLLWTYMFWSQYFVIWYGNLPNITEPFFKGMKGNYASMHVAMLLFCFVIPFITLIIRRIKASIPALSTVAFIICVGMLINRYLMIIPVFSDGSTPAVATWTGLSLILAGLASVLLSVILFLKLFPKVGVMATPVHED
ncbi:MAG: hypothetical protein IME96_06145 [Proteobacteria bacterium]|nr:hypothetical protein [Pseudomonadota bacterium]